MGNEKEPCLTQLLLTRLPHSLRGITRVVDRRYLLQHVGLEIFFHDEHRRLFLSFSSTVERNSFHEKLIAQPSVALETTDQVRTGWKLQLPGDPVEFLQFPFSQ